VKKDQSKFFTIEKGKRVDFFGEPSNTKFISKTKKQEPEKESEKEPKKESEKEPKKKEPKKKADPNKKKEPKKKPEKIKQSPKPPEPKKPETVEEWLQTALGKSILEEFEKLNRGEIKKVSLKPTGIPYRIILLIAKRAMKNKHLVQNIGGIRQAINDQRLERLVGNAPALSSEEIQERNQAWEESVEKQKEYEKLKKAKAMDERRRAKKILNILKVRK